MKLLNKALNYDAIMKELEVLVPEGRAFSIFYCNEEINLLAFTYSALHFVIYCENDWIILSFSIMILRIYYGRVYNISCNVRLS